MEEARHILGTCGPEIDIIVAREHAAVTRQTSSGSGAGGGGIVTNSAAAAERRKRRKLPQVMVERPQSAPVYKNVVTERTIMSTGDITKTVIMIGDEEEPGADTEKPRSQSVQRRPSRNDHQVILSSDWLTQRIVFSDWLTQNYSHFWLVDSI